MSKKYYFLLLFVFFTSDTYADYFKLHSDRSKVNMRIDNFCQLHGYSCKEILSDDAQRALLEERRGNILNAVQILANSYKKFYDNESGLNLNPKNQLDLLHLVRLLYRLKGYDDVVVVISEQSLNKEIENQVFNDFLNEFIASSYFNIGEYENSFKAYMRVLDSQEMTISSAINLSSLLARKGQCDSAWAFAQKAFSDRFYRESFLKTSAEINAKIDAKCQKFFSRKMMKFFEIEEKENDSN